MSSYKKRKYAAVEGVPSFVPSYRGTPVRSYGPSRADMGLSIIQKRQVGRLISQKTETKTHDVTFGATGVSTAGTMTSLCDIPQGVTDVTRIGDTVNPKRLQLRFQLIGADAPSNVFRVIVFRWKMNTASDVPSLDEILEGGYAGSYSIAPYSEHNRKRFEILWDKIYTLNPNAASTSNTIFVTKFLKLAKQKIEYQYSTADGQDKIYMVTVSDSGAISHPTMQLMSRLWFTDS